VDFDRLTIVLLLLRTDAPELDEEASAALQDAWGISPIFTRLATWSRPVR
jgi:hypothetical protein